MPCALTPITPADLERLAATPDSASQAWQGAARTALRAAAARLRRSEAALATIRDLLADADDLEEGAAEDGFEDGDDGLTIPDARFCGATTRGATAGDVAAAGAAAARLRRELFPSGRAGDGAVAFEVMDGRPVLRVLLPRGAGRAGAIPVVYAGFPVVIGRLG